VSKIPLSIVTRKQAAYDKRHQGNAYRIPESGVKIARCGGYRRDDQGQEPSKLEESGAWVVTKVDIQFWERFKRPTIDHEPEGSWLVILWSLRGYRQGRHEWANMRITFN
jgi:hypothetical protein